MRIVVVNGFRACCEAKGVQREVNLFALQHESLRPGDHVMVHAGYAIQKITPQQAANTWELLDQMLAAAEDSAGDA